MVNCTGISYDYLINWSLYELHLPPCGNNAWLSWLHNLASCWLNHNICWVLQRLGRSGDPSLLRWRSIGHTLDELSRRTLQNDLSLSKREYQVLVKFFRGGLMYCLKNEQNGPRVFKAYNQVQYTTWNFLNGFKISDIYQLILALIFWFGVILVQEIGR